MADAAARKSALQMMKDYFLDFKVLKEVPREYWGVQVVNFLDSIAYFSITTIITLLLSREFGLSDKGAGRIASIGTMGVTVSLILGIGAISDWLGIRRSINLALGSKLVVTAGIGALAVAPSFPFRTALVTVLYVLLAPSLASIQSVFQAANKRFTTEKARGAGFNLWYLFMNVGAALSGILIDTMRISLGFGNTGVVLIGVGTSALSMIACSLLIRSEKQVYGAGEKPPETPAVPEKKKSPWQNFLLIVKEPAFWRFVVLTVAFLGVRAVYIHMIFIMPKYWERTIGPDVVLGLLEAINPVLIIVGLVVFIPVANKFHVFKQLVFGAMVSAASLFVLMIPWAMVAPAWSPLAKVLSFVYPPAAAAVGAGAVESGYYVLAFLSMIVLSVGEIFWSPKLYEYTAAIAPEGQEGAYFGFSLLPWFGAKLIVTWLSGDMLGAWCPRDMRADIAAGTLGFWHSPEAMWLVLGLWAMSGPVIALFFEKWLTKGARFKKQGDDKPAAETAEAGSGA